MPGNTIFSLSKLSETAYFQGKLSGKRKTISVIFNRFLEVFSSFARDKEIHEALIETKRDAKNPGNTPFPGFFHAKILLICFRKI